MKLKSLAARQAVWTILLGFFPFVAVMMSGYVYLTGLSDKEQISSRYYSMQSVAAALNYAISNFDQTSQYIVGSEPIRAFLRSDAPVGSSDHLLLSGAASSALSLLPFTTSPGQTCAVFSMDGRKVSRGVSDRIAITQEEKRRCEALNGRWFWSVDGDRLAMCRLLRDKEWVANYLGYIKILVEKDSLTPLFSVPWEMNGAEYAFILYDLDSDQVLLDNLSPLEYDWIWDELDVHSLNATGAQSVRLWHGASPYCLMACQLEGGRSVLLALTPDSGARYHLLQMGLLAVALLLSLLLVSTQILIFRHVVVRPIKKLGALMASVENEDFGVSFPIRRQDEIAQLAQRFNSMALRLQQLHRQVYQSQLSMRAAEIKILEKEINPHFLFNTLNTIYWTIQVGNAAAAGQMIQDLSNLFRLSLFRADDDLIPLDMELEHMRCYLALQKMRLGDSLEYSVDVQPGLQGAKVIKLVLQPLVENAIVHGITPQEGGEISVSVYTDGGALYYVVYDSGVGADPQRIASMLHTPPGEGAGHGIALYNVHERIVLKFGQDYGLTCQRPADGGSVFTVRQPLLQDDPPSKGGHDASPSDRG